MRSNFTRYGGFSCFARLIRKVRIIAANGLALGAVADIEAIHCQPELKFDRCKKLQICTPPAIAAKRLLWAGFIFF